MQYFNGTDYDILYPQCNLENISSTLTFNNISGNLSASRVNYSNSSTSTAISSSNVQDAIDDLFTYVSNGKNQIASAITDMGVSTSGSSSWSVIAENIGKIETGLFFKYDNINGSIEGTPVIQTNSSGFSVTLPGSKYYNKTLLLFTLTINASRSTWRFLGEPRNSADSSYSQLYVWYSRNSAGNGANATYNRNTITIDGFYNGAESLLSVYAYFL